MLGLVARWARYPPIPMGRRLPAGFASKRNEAIGAGFSSDATANNWVNFGKFYAAADAGERQRSTSGGLPTELSKAFSIASGPSPDHQGLRHQG